MVASWTALSAVHDATIFLSLGAAGAERELIEQREIASFVRYNGHRPCKRPRDQPTSDFVSYWPGKDVLRDKRMVLPMQSEIVASTNPVRWGVLSVANIAVKRVIPAIVA